MSQSFKRESVVAMGSISVCVNTLFQHAVTTNLLLSCRPSTNSNVPTLQSPFSRLIDSAVGMLLRESVDVLMATCCMTKPNGMLKSPTLLLGSL